MSFRSLLVRGLLLWWCLGCLLSYFWPNLFAGAFDPFVLSKPILRYLIVIIMFVIGCLLRPEELRQVWLRWPTVLAGTGIQYIAMPVLAWTLGTVFQLSGEDWIGLMMVACVPGAMASNVLTLIARGNVSYSISLTATATLLSPVVVPFMLFLTLHKEVALDPLEVFSTLVLTVVVPIVAGFSLCRVWKEFTRIMPFWGPVVANLTILWLIACVVGLNRDRLGQDTVVMVGILLLLNVLGYLSGYLGATGLRFPKPMRRALTIEVGMQNAGLGTTLALTLFEDQPGSAIPPALYTFGCMLTGTGLALFWGRGRETSTESIKY